MNKFHPSFSDDSTLPSRFACRNISMGVVAVVIIGIFTAWALLIFIVTA